MKNDKKNYLRIGTFTKDRDGTIDGKLYGLGLGVIPVTFEPAETKEGKSFLRGVVSSADVPYEIGAAFPREDKNQTPYYSVTLDSVMFPAPINAALFPDKNNEAAFNLVWTRPDIEHAPKAEATVNVNVPSPMQAESANTPAAPAETGRSVKGGRRSLNGSQPQPV